MIGTEAQSMSEEGLLRGRRRWQPGGWEGLLSLGGLSWGWRRREVGTWRRNLAVVEEQEAGQ